MGTWTPTDWGKGRGEGPSQGRDHSPFKLPTRGGGQPSECVYWEKMNLNVEGPRDAATQKREGLWGNSELCRSQADGE